MLQTTRLEHYSGNGLVAKRSSKNFSKFNEHGAATCPCNCRAISKSFSDTLSEMTPNISDIKQKFGQCPKKKKNTVPTPNPTAAIPGPCLCKAFKTELRNC